MKTVTFDTPALFGDHHVMEVRRILLDIKGVKEVYASSAFHAVEVKFDAKAVSERVIEACLQDAGYLGELPLTVETGVARPRNDSDGQFRHTTTYAATQQVVSFAQRVNYQGRPLWPCPGMGPVEIKVTVEE